MQSFDRPLDRKLRTGFRYVFHSTIAAPGAIDSHEGGVNASFKDYARTIPTFRGGHRPPCRSDNLTMQNTLLQLTQSKWEVWTTGTAMRKMRPDANVASGQFMTQVV